MFFLSLFIKKRQKDVIPYEISRQKSWREKNGAGHVATEVFLNDLKKWVFIDVQFDAMPVLNDTPLNAVEFQKAITENFDQLEIKTSSDTPKSIYTNWI